MPGVPTEAIQPVGIAITPDRKLAFVALGPANRVAVVDAQSYEVLKYLLVGQRVWSLAFNHDQSGDAEAEYDRLRDLARQEANKRGDCFHRVCSILSAFQVSFPLSLHSIQVQLGL